MRLRAEEYTQPILKAIVSGQPVFLLPSRCHEATLPKDFTKDTEKKKDLRYYMITDPAIRYERIKELTTTTLAQAIALADWNLKVGENFACIKSKQLYHPKLMDLEMKRYTMKKYKEENINNCNRPFIEKLKWAIVF